MAASRGSDNNGAQTQRYVSRWRHYSNMLFLTNNQSGSNLILSNDDSTSIPNGHEVELLNNVQNANLSGSSDEVILMSDGDHAPSLITNNGMMQFILLFLIFYISNQILVGILANNHNSQRIYPNNNNSTSTNSSITISTLPVSSLSVIHAPSSTTSNNLTSTPINSSKLKFNSQNSNIQQQPTFLIKNSSANGTTTPTIIVPPTGGNISLTSSTRARNQPYSGTIPESINSATQIVPLQQSALSQNKKGQSLIVMTSMSSNKDQHPVQHPVSTSFDSLQPQVRSLLITPDINVFSDNSLNHGESNSGNSSLLTNNSNNSSQYFKNKQAENELLDWIKTVVHDSLIECEDEEMSFCRSLAAPLRTLDRTKKDIVKLELQQVIVRHTNPNYLGCNSTSNHSYTNNGKTELIKLNYIFN